MKIKKILIILYKNLDKFLTDLCNDEHIKGTRGKTIKKKKRNYSG